MYTPQEVMSDASVKRLQIMIEEELDEALALRARREGTSKAALLRQFAWKELKPLPPIEDDPLWELVGSVDADPVDDIDEFLYGPSSR